MSYFSMKTVSCLILTVALLIVSAGCAKPVRYSSEEIKDYPYDIQEKIIRGEISLSMTPKQVRYAWGPPDMVRTLDSVDGKKREEWTYTSFLGMASTRKLLFLDNKLLYITPEPERLSDPPAREQTETDKGTGLPGQQQNKQEMDLK